MTNEFRTGVRVSLEQYVAGMTDLVVAADVGYSPLHKTNDGPCAPELLAVIKTITNQSTIVKPYHG